MGLACIIAYIVYLIDIFTVTGANLIQMEFKFLCLQISFFAFLFFSYIYSMVTLSKSMPSENQNRLFQMLNLLFFTGLLVVEAFYMVAWSGEFHKDMVFIAVLRVFIQFCEKIVLLLLMKQFGNPISVKAKVLGNGDLMIVGVDTRGVEIFQLQICQDLKSSSRSTSQ